MFQERTARLVHLPSAPLYLPKGMTTPTGRYEGFLVHFIVGIGPPRLHSRDDSGSENAPMRSGRPMTYGASDYCASESYQPVNACAHPGLPWLDGSSWDTASHL
jgi:hypothetical protein